MAQHTQKLLPLALKARRHDLAAYALVYGLVKARLNEKENDNHAHEDPRGPKGQPERP